ncbi:hypothetical protein RF55_16743 [Lasius niger]|uniref:Uncharacterized protein n=1 Tax=Lasius niger TaxID=67767 RepID=A0A0J7K3K5_LASNI|nr:hypothetical protein RF55_16743 [Lasius niger]
MRFLEDTRDTLLNRVHDVRGRLDNVYVNTEFNEKFVASVKTAVRTIATKNHPLSLRLSDLREWYGKKHVVNAILALLKEFQKRNGRCRVYQI